jgi:hypothetical protein
VQRTRRTGISRGQTAGALLSATLSLAAALAFAAPLAHVHLEASGAMARGLCGEHVPGGDEAPQAEACSICLAGGHAIGAADRAFTCIEAPAVSNRTQAPASPAAPAALHRRPGAPRAPPFSV